MTTAAPPAAEVPGPEVPDKRRLLPKAGLLLRRTAGVVLLAAAVAAFLFLAVGPRFLGYETDTVDVQAAAVPYLGAAVRMLREPAVLMALTYVAPGVVVFVMLARIWRKGPDAAAGSRNGADGAKTPASG